jgi:hypothetical protein
MATGSELSSLFEDHVRLFNEGVRGGNFEPMVAGFAPDAEMVFVGVPVGPFLGRAAIAEAYGSQPPTDEMIVLDVSEPGSQELEARYAWSASPETQAGRLRCTFAGRSIAKLVVTFQMD